MNEERLRELARDPNHIRGIYNSCDLWCERCKRQAKCLVFAVEQEQKAPGEDATGSVEDSLRLAQQMLAQQIEGADLSAGISTVETDREEAAFDRLRSHPLIRQAEEYAFGTAAHVEALGDALLAAAQSVQQKIELGIVPNQGLTTDDLESCGDALETILHFRFLICSKLFRALSGMAIRSGQSGPDPYCVEDARRSAGIAWKGIQRSIEAWLILRRPFPRREAGILDMLLQLDRLRREVEMMFPETTEPA